MNSDYSPNARTWLKLIEDRVDRLRFGVVQIVVHDSRVVQIEATEKVRLDQTEAENPRTGGRREEATVIPPSTRER